MFTVKKGSLKPRRLVVVALAAAATFGPTAQWDACWAVDVAGSMIMGGDGDGGWNAFMLAATGRSNALLLCVAMPNLVIEGVSDKWLVVDPTWRTAESHRLAVPAGTGGAQQEVALRAVGCTRCCERDSCWRSVTLFGLAGFVSRRCQ